MSECGTCFWEGGGWCYLPPVDRDESGRSKTPAAARCVSYSRLPPVAEPGVPADERGSAYRRGPYSTESGRHAGTTLTDATVGARGPLADSSPNTPGNLPASSSPAAGGYLNPAWVEALMGAPPGWTELPEEIARELYVRRGCVPGAARRG